MIDSSAQRCFLYFVIGWGLFGASLPSDSAATPPVTAIAFSPDGKSLVAVSQSGIEVRTWPGLKVVRAVDVTAPNLHCCVYSPNGKRLAVGGGYPAEEGVVKVYSWPELELLKTDTGHDDSVVALAWRDDQKLISASLDRLIRQFSLGSELPVRSLAGHSRGVTALCLLRGSKLLVSGGEDQSLRVWDLEENRVRRSLNQHTEPIHAMTARPAADGLPMVASSSADRTIRFWQPTIGRMVRYARLTAQPLSIAWADDRRVVAGCSDGRLRVVDAVEVSVIGDYPAIDGWAYAVAVHPTDGSVAVGGSDSAVRRIELVD